jgi:CheY-like chemotaxis protein/HD-like signal output (HDOD) protein
VDISAPPENYSILVVDDDEMIRRVIQNTLTKFGYRVTSATDGTSALKQATELRPSVILVDLRMPGIDGHTIMRRARAQGIDAAFVVISGSKDPEDIIDALRNGACDYLPKPFSVADLMTAIGRAVDAFEKSRQRPEEEIAPPPPVAAGRPAATAAPSAPAAPTVVAAPPPVPAPGHPTVTATMPAGDPIFSSILRRVHEGEILIPAVPTVVLELRRLLTAPETTLEQVTALIERDQRLSAQLLRISNTTPYARGAQNASIRTAVSRVGLRQIQSLIETIFAHSACTVRDPELAPLQASIWRFSVARAVAMRALAEAHPAPRPDVELAYLAGLFCDVGASFLLWIVSERNASAATNQKLGRDACVHFIGQNHHSVGAAVLARWSVDPTMTMLARLHHANTLANPVNAYSALECAAVPVAEKLAGGPDVTGPPRSASLIEECTRRLKVPATDVLLAKVQPTFEAIINTLA